MTRSQNDRLTELENEQTRMREVTRIRAEQAEHGGKLSEIIASLAVLTRAMVPPVTPKKAADDVGRIPATELHGEGVLSNPTITLLPSFDGGDPIGWIARVEQQFELHNTLPEKKVAAAMVAMEGGALYWVTWLRSRKPGISWEDFKQALVARFDSQHQGNRFERLSGVKQTEFVEDCNILFVQLASQVPGLTDDHYLGYYMSGLKETIRSSLRLLRPNNLEMAMELAREVEHNLSVQRGEKGSLNYHSSGVRSSSLSMAHTSSPLTAIGGSLQGSEGSFAKDSGQPPGTKSGLPGQPTTRSQFTRLAPKEFAELRVKGLCFRCDCPFKQLGVMIAEEDEELDLKQHEFCEITGQERVQEREEGYFSGKRRRIFFSLSMTGNFSSRSASFQP
ncbi:unnamed protein product [Cuscuta epithymum]|uniref:Ty3 transposon capsid-like protein domain-containing protein n=1 Tax=Cuscuta epithymum TaxID=186058 RepID=A0AAV0CUM1_9ASTE|nr:unnamed protein product [Cuscuta epithymum]CAH9148901.1 unnamed protein product [Cuscuta epithymum]